MGYTALYRKFRPQTFEDVKGQEHIVTTLKNQLKAGRIGHAYLFCGTRGTGKTTVAKIFAKAVNCENPRDGSPCGECAMCKAIAAGTSMNVAEIDAASNNSVENVRNIIDEIAYRPVEGRYKVYIMDEAHMLSEGARNALLKTLEEPPEYVIFILATTEVPRIPITIMSRCQRYDFKRIPITTIAARMKELVDEEGIDVEEKALSYVAKAADGSMRDGLSLLDQCIAFHFGETLTYDKVLDILGAVDTEVFSRLFRMLEAQDIGGAMALLEDVVMQGSELGQFVTDFLWYLRSLMLIKSSSDGDMEDFLNVSGERLQAMKEEAAMVDMETVFRYIEVFSELSGRLRFATQKRILVEMYLIRLMRPQMDTDSLAVLERIRHIEKRLEEGVFTAAPVAQAVDAPRPGTMDPAQKEKLIRLEKALPEEIRELAKPGVWNEVTEHADGYYRPLLRKADLCVDSGGGLVIGISDQYSFVKGHEEIRDVIDAILKAHCGKEVPFQVIMRKPGSEGPADDGLADLRQIIGVAVEEED